MEQVKQMVAAGTSVAAAVKDALKRKGLTIAALADEHGRSRARLSGIVNLQVTPELEDAQVFASALGGGEMEWMLFLHDAADPRKRLATPV